jgi:RNA polymerase sigma-70 factor, ECF subfamily
MVPDEAGRAAERVARENYGRLVAFLASRTRDVAGAEDVLADAFVQALRTWPEDGVPANPNAWLLTVARRRQTDAFRRRQTRTSGEEDLRLRAEEMEAEADEPQTIPDRRLALMFACAHPAIERGMRAPLILQTILGLTAAEIAAAFLIPPATMGQRLARAKTRIKDTGIPFGIPEHQELPVRLDAVLEAIYAAYGKGWATVGNAGTPELANEAIWLGRLVVSLMPEEPEAKGMLALMLYTEARRVARRDATAAFVPLENQDTNLWDGSAIAAAEALLRAAHADGPTGRYQLEAAIQSAHISRRMTGVANWEAVVALYDHLLARTRSPVVAINRAVALAETEGPAAALKALEPVAADRRMQTYQPYWAACGHLLARSGKKAEAQEAFTIAIGLAEDEAERQYLRGRIGALEDGGAEA